MIIALIYSATSLKKIRKRIVCSRLQNIGYKILMKLIKVDPSREVATELMDGKFDIVKLAIFPINI